MVCYVLVYWLWTVSDHLEGTRGCPTWSTNPPQRTSSFTAVSGLGSPRSTSPFLRPRGAPTSPTARMWSHVSLRSCAFTNMAQSQEQVHTVAAQVRTSIERSCINSQDALIGAQNTPKALGDLLCNVNIVWFRVHNRSPVKLAVSISILMNSVKLVTPVSQSLQF